MGILNWSNALSFAGGAAASIGHEGVRASLEQQKIELADRLAGVREEARDKRLDASAAARDERQAALQRELQGDRQAHDVALADARRAWETEQKDLDRGLTREQIEANKAERKADRDNAMAIAKMGGVIQTDPEGNVFMVGKDGTTKQITDPDGKPLKTAKDLTPAAKQYAEVLKDRMRAIENNQLMTPEEKDKRIATLNEELLTTVTRGIGGLKKDEAPKIPTPRTQAEFDALAPGAEFINPADGKTYKKKAGQKQPVAAAAPGIVDNRPLAQRAEEAGLLAKAKQGFTI